MSAEVGHRYLHYEGNEYTILCLGRDRRTAEQVVIYQGNYTDPTYGENPIWTQSLDEFLSSVEHKGKRVPRFTRLG